MPGPTSTWTALGPFANPSPPLIESFAMSYAGPGKILVYGGAIHGGVGGDSNQTWLLDSTGWTRKADGPHADHGLYGMQMCWVGDGVLMFGGFGFSFIPSFYNGTWQETWKYDVGGDTWTQLSPATVPPDRYQHVMGWDGTRALMYGGVQQTGGPPNPTVDLFDTWAYESSNWSDITPATAPDDAVSSVGIASDGTNTLMVNNTKTWSLTSDWADLGIDATAIGFSQGSAQQLVYDDPYFVAAGQPQLLKLADAAWITPSATGGPGSNVQGGFGFDGSRLIYFGGHNLVGSGHGDVDNPGDDTDGYTNQTWLIDFVVPADIPRGLYTTARIIE